MAELLRELYAKGLQAKGFQRVETKGRRYWVFTQNGVYYFLGKAGAVRIGTTKNALDSRPASDAIKHLLKEAAK